MFTVVEDVDCVVEDCKKLAHSSRAALSVCAMNFRVTFREDT